MKISMETVLYIALVLLQIGVVQAQSHCNAAANGFVTTDYCDYATMFCIGCFKVFPITTESYLSMICMAQDALTEHNLECPNPCDDYCWVSYEIIQYYDLYNVEGLTNECVPHTGGDRYGVIPIWCHAPQGQLEFFTMCNDISITYTCNVTQYLFINNFEILRFIHDSRSLFSCDGVETEETLRRCLSSWFALFLRDVTTPCTDVRVDECYHDFAIALSGNCPELIDGIMQLSADSQYDSFNIDPNLLENINNCLGTL